MKCPYINPTTSQCLNCNIDTCDGGKGKETKEKQKRHYNRHIVKMREYHRGYQRENYDTKENTEKCRRHRLRHTEQKKIYDHMRYERKKAERVS